MVIPINDLEMEMEMVIDMEIDTKTMTTVKLGNHTMITIDQCLRHQEIIIARVRQAM